MDGQIRHTNPRSDIDSQNHVSPLQLAADGESTDDHALRLEQFPRLLPLLRGLALAEPAETCPQVNSVEVVEARCAKHVVFCVHKMADGIWDAERAATELWDYVEAGVELDRVIQNTLLRLRRPDRRLAAAMLWYQLYEPQEEMCCSLAADDRTAPVWLSFFEMATPEMAQLRAAKLALPECLAGRQTKIAAQLIKVLEAEPLLDSLIRRAETAVEGLGTAEAPDERRIDGLVALAAGMVAAMAQRGEGPDFSRAARILRVARADTIPLCVDLLRTHFPTEIPRLLIDQLEESSATLGDAKQIRAIRVALLDSYGRLANHEIAREEAVRGLVVLYRRSLSCDLSVAAEVCLALLNTNFFGDDGPKAVQSTALAEIASRQPAITLLLLTQLCRYAENHSERLRQVFIKAKPEDLRSAYSRVIGMMVPRLSRGQDGTGEVHFQKLAPHKPEHLLAPKLQKRWIAWAMSASSEPSLRENALTLLEHAVTAADPAAVQRWFVNSLRSAAEEGPDIRAWVRAAAGVRQLGSLPEF